jgi:putative addiction module component (TIGR02574 family)
MNSATEQLLDAVLALPDCDRAEFLEALVASLRPDDRSPFDESWRKVIQRRTDELQSGQVQPVPWAEVKRQTRNKVGG